MTTTVASGGYEFSHDSVGGKWYWTVLASNVKGAGQLYQVTGIRSPFGPMAQSLIPIPGDVVLKMADSIQEMQQTLAPLIALVSPGTTTFSVTVVEGDAASLAATVPFQNSGAFGSFLTATATPGVPWLKAVPTSVVGLGRSEQSQFAIQVLPATLLASGSPYSGTVNLQDNRSPATVIPITVNVTVLPKPAITASAAEITLTYSIGTATVGSPQTLTLTNSGGAGSQLSAVLSKVQNASPWLSFTPPSVGPVASGGTADVVFSLVPGSIPGLTGTYVETIKVASPTASNSPVAVTVKLVVSP